MKAKYNKFFLFCFLLCCFVNNSKTYAQDKNNLNNNFSFIAAGHAYGGHHGTNLGLYPKFFEYMKTKRPENIKFIIFCGDIVRNSTPQSWNAVFDDIRSIGLKTFLVMGNHDFSETGVKIFNKLYGNTFYKFSYGNADFIALDTNKKRGFITEDQIKLIRNVLENDRKFLFLFTNELIWTSRQPKYNKVRHNFGSYSRYFGTNFWNEIFPILKQYPGKEIFFIAGDVAGNPNVIPAFYEKVENVALIATGMGEIKNENFLLITIKNNNVELKLFPLNEDNNLLEIKEYNLENLNNPSFGKF